jgi:hypothetical protein
MNDAYESMVLEIIKSQENIIGPIAIERAGMVDGMNLDFKQSIVTFSKDPIGVLDSLVEQYRQLFGQISVEVCKEAAQHVAGNLTADQLPRSLR